MKKLQIGVDGGATTTRAVVIDENRSVCGRGEAGSSNSYSIGWDTALQNVQAAVQAALHDANAQWDDVASWGLGLAGACSEREHTDWRTRLQPMATDVRIVVDEDAAAAQSGAFGGGPGAICIAGTGANAFGINERGQRARADGVGPLLGDRGSGYWIGEQTLRAVTRFCDGVGPQTSLRDKVFAHWNTPTLDDMVQLVYRPEWDKSRIASLVPLVVQAAQENDAVALSILQDAGTELALSSASVLQQLGVARVAPVGGVLSRDNPVRQSFENTLRERIPNVYIQEPLFDAAVGAALLARL